MNKKLILQYQKEFEHWLKGNTLMCLLDGEDEDWFKVKSITKIWDSDYHNPIKEIVIDDNYVELRKHGAEGKQLQVSYNDGKTWYDKQYHKISWNDGQLVRKKPEYTKEPGVVIKPGDFVITPTGISGVIEHNGTLSAANYYALEDCKLWKPSEKDLVWRRNSALSDEKESILSYYKPEFDKIYNLIEPYISGQLPTWIKK